jgi:hypothetical protein
MWSAFATPLLVSLCSNNLAIIISWIVNNQSSYRQQQYRNFFQHVAQIPYFSCRCGYCLSFEDEFENEP